MVFRSVSKPENHPEPSRNSPLVASSTTVKPHHQPLHNFPLQDLKWSISSNNNNNGGGSNNNSSSSGNQNHQRFRKSSSPCDHSEKKKSVVCGDDVSVEEKGKIFIRLKSNNNCNNGGGKSSDDVTLEEEFLEAKTWNLRPRKAVAKPAPPRAELIRSESTRSKSVGEVKPSGEKKAAEEEEEEEKEKQKQKKKQKFSISLSKEEIEEDVFVLTGSKPVRRPKKRPRHVQKLLDSVFPGLWLASVTPDSYRVDPHTKG